MIGNGGKSKKQSPIAMAFLKYELAIKRVITRMTGSGGESDDLAQEVFLRAVIAENRTQIDDPKAYLFAAARNTALTSAVKRSRKIVEVVEDVTELEVPDNRAETEDVMVGRERYALFCEAVALLPPQCRKVFIMCKIYGRSHKEISRTLCISVSTVEKHIGTGLAKCLAYMRAHEEGVVSTGRLKSIDGTATLPSEAGVIK